MTLKRFKWTGKKQKFYFPRTKRIRTFDVIIKEDTKKKYYLYRPENDVYIWTVSGDVRYYGVLYSWENKDTLLVDYNWD